MSISKKINWVVSWAALRALRHTLSHRIQDGKNKMQGLLPKLSAVDIYNRVDFIINFCTNKNVLHIGCTDYPYTFQKLTDNSLLHLQVKQVAATLSGVDNSEQSIKDFRNFTGNHDVYYGDILQSYPPQIIAAEVDVILLSEVLEHLINPVQALDVLHSYFNNGTQVLVTVPNYTSLNSIGASLHKTELIHPDHYWYFSPYTLCKLFGNHKFELQQLYFGMYYQKNKKINAVMKEFSFNADCIIAVFLLKK